MRYIGSASGGALWPDPLRGPWSVTVHWGEVDGKAIPIGMDIRCFKGVPGSSDDPPRPRFPRAAPWSASIPLSAEMVRALRVGELISESHAHVEEFEEWLATRTPAQRRRETKRSQRPKPHRGRPLDRDMDHYQRVADLYLEAVTTGSRTPAKSVYEALKADGVTFTSQDERGQVRKWIATAKDKHLLRDESKDRR